MKKIALFTLLTLLLCTSCVTKKKFMMTEAARMASIDSLQSLLTDCRNTGDQMSAQIKKLLRDTTQMGNSIRQYQSMLSTNMTEQEKLNALLSQKKNELSSSVLKPSKASFTLFSSCFTFSFWALIMSCSSLMVRSLSLSSFFF